MEISLPVFDKNSLEEEEYNLKHNQDLFPPVEQKIIKWLMEAGIEMKDPSECARDYYSRKNVRSKTNTFCLQLGDKSPLFMKRKSPAEALNFGQMINHNNFSTASASASLSAEGSESGMNKKQPSSDAISPSWSIKMRKIEENQF